MHSQRNLSFFRTPSRSNASTVAHNNEENDYCIPSNNIRGCYENFLFFDAEIIRGRKLLEGIRYSIIDQLYLLVIRYIFMFIVSVQNARK